MKYTCFAIRISSKCNYNLSKGTIILFGIKKILPKVDNKYTVRYVIFLFKHKKQLWNEK